MFIESFLASNLANAIALKATADAFKEESLRSGTIARGEPDDDEPRSIARTGVQKELYERAGRAVEDGKPEVAIPLLIRAIKLDPDYPLFYASLGICYHGLGQFDNALEYYDKALDLEGKVYNTTDDFLKLLRELSDMCEKGEKTTSAKECKTEEAPPLEGSEPTVTTNMSPDERAKADANTKWYSRI